MISFADVDSGGQSCEGQRKRTVFSPHGWALHDVPASFLTASPPAPLTQAGSAQSPLHTCACFSLLVFACFSSYVGCVLPPLMAYLSSRGEFKYHFCFLYPSPATLGSLQGVVKLSCLCPAIALCVVGVLSQSRSSGSGN